MDTPLPPTLLAALEPEDLLALERDLGGLGTLSVPPAARERGWVLVRQEVQAREALGAHRVWKNSTERRNWRGMAAAAFTMAALVLGSLGIQSMANLRVADVSSSTIDVAEPPVSSVPGGGHRPGDTGVVVAPTGPGSLPSITTVAGSATSGSTWSTETTLPPSTSGSTVPSTTGLTTVTVTTTQTEQSTSTSRQVMTKEERQNTAVGVVSFLAQAVIAGNLVDAASQVTPEASAGLTKLVALLENPSGYSVEPLGESSNGDISVVLEIEDTLADEEGGVSSAAVRFIVSVRLVPDAALIVAIYSAP